MNVLVDPRVVLQSVNPVDEEIGEEQVHSHARDQIRPSVITDIVVQLAVTVDLAEEPWQCHDIDDGRSNH